MKKTVIEGALWVGAGLVLWLAPPSWKPLAYVLIGVAVIVAIGSYVDSQRRLKRAKAAVDTSTRALDELRRNARGD